MNLSRSLISWIYLFLCLLGAILPTLSNLEFISNYGPGFDIQHFIQMANQNEAAQSISRDLLVGASAFSIWIFVESNRLKMKNLWIVIICMFLVAFAFAAPLFLYLRERRLAELEKDGISFSLSDYN